MKSKKSYAIIEKFSKFRKCTMSNDNSNLHVFSKQQLIWSSPYIRNLNQRIFLFGRTRAILWGNQIQLVWFGQQTLCMAKIKLGAACQKYETHSEVWYWVGNGLGIIFLIWAWYSTLYRWYHGLYHMHMYLNILKESLPLCNQKLCLGESFYFYQDNDPKHKAYNVYTWCTVPIENLWCYLNSKIRNHTISALQDECDKIESSFCEKLLHSRPNRWQEVIKKK